MKRPETELKTQLESLKESHARMMDEEAALRKTIAEKRTLLEKILDSNSSEISKAQKFEASKNDNFDNKLLQKSENDNKSSANFLNGKQKPILSTQDQNNKCASQNNNSINKSTKNAEDPFSFGRLIKQIKKICGLLNLGFEVSDNSIEQLKIIEGKFHQLVLQNRTIKLNLPEVYFKLVKEYTMSQKKDPKQIKEQMKQLQRNERVQKKMSRVKKAKDLKRFRVPMTKFILSSKKPKVVNEENTQSKLEDEKYFS